MICFTSNTHHLLPDMSRTFSSLILHRENSRNFVTSEERAQKFHADAASLRTSYLDMGSASDE